MLLDDLYQLGSTGTSSLDLGGGEVVGAIVAVNAVGGVYEVDTGGLVAGPLAEDGASMLESLSLVTTPGYTREPPPGSPARWDRRCSPIPCPYRCC